MTGNVPLDNAQFGWDEDGNFVTYYEWNGNYIRDSSEHYLHRNMTLSGPNKNTFNLYQPNLIEQVDLALTSLGSYRSYLGAMHNRLDSVIFGLEATGQDLRAARSRIEDADYAVEVSNMTRAQILQQAGQAMLAQANQIPQGILALLR